MSVFADLPQKHFGAILADPPWHFQSWADNVNKGRWNGNHEFYTPSRTPQYKTMSLDDIASLPVGDVASQDAVLFCWGIWVLLPQALDIIGSWGFDYKTCAFNWIKADIGQIDLFKNSDEGQTGLGYWVRQNSEFCLLATRGKPKRLSANVRQGIIARRREHSRKPDCVHERIERLVAGPYLELFARQNSSRLDLLGQ